jgi:hypothetical protein
MSRRQRVPVHPVRKWFPDRGSAFVVPSVRIFYSTRIRANLLWWKQEKAPRQVLSCLKNGVRLSFHPPPPPPACISIACARQGCRVRHTGPVQRGHFGRVRPVAVSRLRLSLQSARSHASERKAANGTQLPLSELILQEADVSIRASQGSSQASTTPRLTAQSRCQRSVLACSVTPSYSALPQLSSGAFSVIRERFRSHRPGTPSTRGLLGVAPRLPGSISGGGKNVCSTVVRIHQRTIYLDQGRQGLDSSYESTRDTLFILCYFSQLQSQMGCFNYFEVCMISNLRFGVLRE